MASGKSLELAKIKRLPPQHLCVCGGIWESHLLKDGSRLKKIYANGEHFVRGREFANRAARRKMRRK